MLHISFSSSQYTGVQGQIYVQHLNEQILHGSMKNLASLNETPRV